MIVIEYTDRILWDTHGDFLMDYWCTIGRVKLKEIHKAYMDRYCFTASDRDECLTLGVL